jgi:hypothetical protein
MIRRGANVCLAVLAFLGDGRFDMDWRGCQCREGQAEEDEQGFHAEDDISPGSQFDPYSFAFSATIQYARLATENSPARSKIA